MAKKIPDITFTNSLKPKKGCILLSDPFLGDEYYERSVVYLCEHSPEGSFGFVINHYIEINLSQLNEDFPDLDTKISIGGPVEKETMYFIHTLAEELNESLEISPGIYIGGDFEQLYTHLTAQHIEDDKIRFFLGYSGWNAGQLQEEIDRHSWVVCEAENAREIMTSKMDDQWKYFMNKLGPKYRLISGFPLDPSDN